MPYCKPCNANHSRSNLGKIVQALEDHADRFGWMVSWDVSEAMLHAAGGPVLIASVFWPHKAEHLSVSIDVGGSPIRVWVKGKTWADGWPWVDDVYGVDRLVETLHEIKRREDNAAAPVLAP